MGCIYNTPEAKLRRLAELLGGNETAERVGITYVQVSRVVNNPNHKINPTTAKNVERVWAEYQQQQFELLLQKMNEYKTEFLGG